MKVVIALLICFYVQETLGKDLFVQGRLFLANNSIDRFNTLNTALESDGLNAIDKTDNLGVEITFPLFRFLEPGMRYTRRSATALESPDNPITNYEAKLSQDTIMLMVRLPIIRSSFFRYDVFGGVGGSNTKLKLHTASGSGELSRAKSGDWVASPTYAIGSSIGIGFRHILLFLEGGHEKNTVDKLKSSGTVPAGINSIDLSGSYFMLGIMFDGIRGDITTLN